MGRGLVVRSAAVILLCAATAVPAAAQTIRPLLPNEPVPKGQRVEVKDGDTVVIPGDARVRIVHRAQATVRAIYNSSQRWLVLLIDYADPKPDGAVDATRTFRELTGVWPLGEHWQGSAVLDDYSMLNTPGGSLGITTDGAFIQLFSGSAAFHNRWFADDRAVAIAYNGQSASNAFPGGRRQTFDEIEERAVAEATTRAENRDGGVSVMPFEGPGGVTVTSRVGMSVSGGGSAGPSRSSSGGAPLAPVRVGGNIRQPAKIADAKPMLPPSAAQAGVRGVVILEIVIGTDGSVTEARVLRSIPLLDEAALDTVKQWRYEVTQLNGQPVPVIMTVTVAFQ